MIGAVVVCLASGWTIAQQTSGNADNTRTETKISESRNKGKFKRITDTFTGKVLVARKEEISTKDDGHIDFAFSRLFRDGQMIFLSSPLKSSGGTLHSYFHQGKMVAEEGDEDGDGFFETMLIFDAKGQPIEGFSKSKDGAVTQFSKEKLDQLIKTWAKLGLGE